ncbi:MAG: hypothetical protein EAZ92_14960, partial [Candidatus Kapaibacterium sp.]
LEGFRKQKKSIQISDAFEMYLNEDCINKTPKTVRGYKDAFRLIVTNNYYITPERILEDLIAFVNTAKPKKKSRYQASTINIHLTAFKTFLTFCYKRNILQDNIDIGRFRPPVTPKKVKTWHSDEIERLQEYFRTRDNEFSLLIKFIAATGWRIGEVLQLTWDKVEETMLYREPKQKGRLDPFPYTDELREILTELKPLSTGDKVFRWSNGSQSSLTRTLNKAMADLNIEKDGRAWHTFRKTAATNWVNDETIPIHEAQTLLGHKNIRTTQQHYVKKDIAKIGEKLNAKNKEKQRK